MNQSLVSALITGGFFVALATIVVALLGRSKTKADATNTNVKTAQDLVNMVNEQLDRANVQRAKDDIRDDRRKTNLERWRLYALKCVGLLERNNIPVPPLPKMLRMDDDE